MRHGRIRRWVDRVAQDAITKRSTWIPQINLTRLVAPISRESAIPATGERRRAQAGIRDCLAACRRSSRRHVHRGQSPACTPGDGPQRSRTPQLTTVAHALACRIKCAAPETGVGPFPDIASHIEKAILVRAETADRLRRLFSHLLAARVPVIDRERPLAGITAVEAFRQGIVVEPAGGRVGPFLVGWQPKVRPLSHATARTHRPGRPANSPRRRGGRRRPRPDPPWDTLGL